MQHRLAENITIDAADFEPETRRRCHLGDLVGNEPLADRAVEHRERGHQQYRQRCESTYDPPRDPAATAAPCRARRRVLMTDFLTLDFIHAVNHQKA